MKIAIKRSIVKTSDKVVKLNQVMSFPKKSEVIVASKKISSVIEALRDISRKVAALQAIEKNLKDEVRGFMGEAVTLMDLDGTFGATWKYNKDSIKVDNEKLELKFPDVYSQVLKTVTGSRVLNIK
jgi:predicted phage-related endonuclease